MTGGRASLKECFYIKHHLPEHINFLLTAGTAAHNPDHVFLKKAILFDKSKVIDAERVNKVMEKQHEQAAHDLEEIIEKDELDLDEVFDEYAYDKSKVERLVHNSDKFTYGSKLDMDHLLTMIPGQLTLAREKMQ